MISNKSYYGVTALVHLATHAKGKHIGLKDIANGRGIPLRFLEQVFARLKGAEIVSSVRGAGGGYRLSRPVREITLFEIISACEGKSELAVSASVRGRVREDDAVGLAFLAAMRTQLDQFNRSLEQVTLHELIQSSGLSAEMYYI